MTKVNRLCFKQEHEGLNTAQIKGNSKQSNKGIGGTWNSSYYVPGGTKGTRPTKKSNNSDKR